MIASYLRDNKRKFMLAGFGIGILVAGFVAGCAYAQQPHMQAAFGYLQSAKGELEVAEHNKGGHRVAAMRLINDAMGEVQAGIAAGS